MGRPHACIHARLPPSFALPFELEARFRSNMLRAEGNHSGTFAGVAEGTFYEYNLKNGGVVKDTLCVTRCASLSLDLHDHYNRSDAGPRWRTSTCRYRLCHKCPALASAVVDLLTSTL